MSSPGLALLGRQMSMHAKPVRGLESAALSPLSQGRFGRIFRRLPAAKYGANDAASEANLKKLAVAMVAKAEDPKDGFDAEESGVPALYTYFGQFIDHDLTFDPVSSLQHQNDPNALVDFRTPAFDLDCVYGRGPNDQPYMYDGNELIAGTVQVSGGTGGTVDLPRASNGRAIIGDPRNDENTIVSQLQGLLLRFHNRTARQMPGAAFEDIQRQVRFHYQYVVLNDFLNRIVHSSVLQELKSNGHWDFHKLKLFKWKHDPFMPVEFAAACYRFGHSMVRPDYRLNDDDATLQQIFPAFTGFQPMASGRGIDWGRFIDVDLRTSSESKPADTKRRLQFAYRIDTSVVNPLGNLPPVIVDSMPSLAERNLRRGFRLGLPSGQCVARAMGIAPLRDDQIIIGKSVDKPEVGDVVGPITADNVGGSVFAGNCPLWTYILAEAAIYKEKETIPVKETGKTIQTPKLGPVGGRIVAEVFLGLMFGDANSMLRLDPGWYPAAGANYRLKDFVNFALGK